MAEVICACCDHYLYYKEKNDNYETALCELCNRRVSGYDKVCEDYILMKGMGTRRTIPDYCKNYK